MRRSGSLAGAAIVLFAVAIAVLSIEFGAEPRSLLARYVLSYGPQEEDLQVVAPPEPPGPRHPLGTDIQRRDYLSRLLHGAKISIQVGLTAEAIALFIGLVAGALAGFYRGWVESLLMRTADILLAFPLPILAMAAIAVFDTRSISLVFIVLGLMGWAGIARLVRAQCLSVNERGFPEAARALGAGDLRLIARHLLPNTVAPALVAGCVGVAGNILTEAWLSFLGLGVQPPAVSWGRMIVDAQSDLTVRPWLCIFPGVAIAITVMGFVLLADGLRDALDPRTRVATHTT
ncbi:MAG TPA: ABC transporter permease [Candidatus Polarisedimenticolia bacterium]|jgi:peptide/nickel transport system permease protein